MSNTIQYFSNRFERMVRAMFNNLNECVNSMEVKIKQFMEDNLPHIKNLHALLERVVTWLDETVRAFNNHPLVQWYYSMLEQIRTGEFMRMIRDWKMQVERYLDELKDRYRMQIDVMIDVWRNIERMPLMRQFTMVLNSIADFVSVRCLSQR